MKTIFALDKQTGSDLGSARKLKYIAKDYTNDGSIIYFMENAKEDGFGDLIRELEHKKKAELIIPADNLQPVFEFLGELKHSVENAKLTLTYKNKKSWKKICFQF